MVYKYDCLVIGSGIAGMSFALKAAKAGAKVGMICKTTTDEANTFFAQGGVASVTNLEKTISRNISTTQWLLETGSAIPRLWRKYLERPSPDQELYRLGCGFR